MTTHPLNPHAHYWLVDRAGHGVCKECGIDRQFPVPLYVTVAWSNHGLLTPSIKDHTFTWTEPPKPGKALASNRKGARPILTPEAVKEIRASTLSASIEAERHGVRKNTIIDCRARRTHKDVV